MSRPDFSQPVSVFKTPTASDIAFNATATTFAVAANPTFNLFNLGKLFTFSWRWFTGQVGADAASIFMSIPFGICPLVTLSVPCVVQSSVTAGEAAIASIFAPGQGGTGNPAGLPVVRFTRLNNSNWLLAETLNCFGQITFEAS